MDHLLIEEVSTVTSGFVQYRARVRVRVKFNRASIEQVVGQTGLFTSLIKSVKMFSRIVNLKPLWVELESPILGASLAKLESPIPQRFEYI
jgi:hypothetical protein